MNRIICFLFTTPVLSSYQKRYGIDYFENHGWSVLIWDLSPIVHPLAYQTIKNGLMDSSKVTVITNKMLYKKNMKNVSDETFFIITEDFNYPTFFYYKQFNQKHHYGYMNRMDTNMEVNITSTKRIKNLFEDFSLRRIKNSIFVRIPRRILPIKAADFVVLGGKANSREYISLCYTGKNTQIKYIHSLDYEKYLEVQRVEERIISERYCVFLDQYFGYHPDVMEMGIHVNAESYYTDLSRFFHYIEETMRIKVIIAAHPRSNYRIHKNAFEGFIIKKNLTCELVKNAEFVLSQHSTAISYAVLYYKPIIFLEVDEHSKIELCKKVLDKYAECLSAPKLNVSNKKYFRSRLEDLFYVDERKYTSFIRNYIKAEYGKPNMDNKSIFEQIENLVLSIIACN